MTIHVQSTTLQNTLQVVYPLVPSKSTLQILYNFKIRVSESKMYVTATDLDHSISSICHVEGDDIFDIAVNAKKLFDIVRQLPDEKVQISVSDNVFSLSDDKGFSCKIACVETDDFPNFPQIDTLCEFDISVTTFQNCIKNGSFAASKDESRGTLCGVLWSIDRQKTGMVSTDGHRLVSSFVAIDTPLDEKMDIIVYPRALGIIERALISNTSDTLHISIGEKYLMVNNAYTSFCTKRISGSYPDYENAIPKQNEKQALLNKRTLYDAVKRVSILTSQNSNLVKFIFQNNSLTLEVLNRDIGGEAKEIIGAEYDEKTQHVLGFNSSYFMEILNIITTDTIMMKMNNSESPCLIFKYDEENKKEIADNLYLIMPLKILEE